MKNKSYLIIEKGITISQKVTGRSLDKVSVSSYKSKNGVILQWSRFCSLAIKVVEIGSILK